MAWLGHIAARMARTLTGAMDCMVVRSILLPFLDLYDAFELAAASTAGNRWTQRLHGTGSFIGLDLGNMWI